MELEREQAKQKDERAAERDRVAIGLIQADEQIKRQTEQVKNVVVQAADQISKLVIEPNIRPKANEKNPLKEEIERMRNLVKDQMENRYLDNEEDMEGKPDEVEEGEFSREEEEEEESVDMD